MTIAMDTRHDPVREELVIYQNPSLFLKVWEVQSDKQTAGIPEVWPWHYHKEVEFLAITEGRAGIQTKDDYRIQDYGDIMLFGSSQLHRIHKALPTPLRFIVLQVDLLQHFDQSSLPYLHCFSELTQPLSTLNYIFREHPEACEEAFSLVNEIYRESQSQQRGYELAIGAAIKKLLLLLLRYDSRMMLQGGDTDLEVTRLRPALDYVERNLGEKITVEEVCSLLNLSYAYFIRYFRTTMGLSFIEFVNYKRVKKAERLLATRDLSITEIACEVGIPSTAQFYKLFKRHNHCSPGEFKARMSGKTVGS
ncbi:AraC family transcriptional regulator [Paenibacillus sp. FSL H7-0331]|uniref:helix-turn-helix domain-containing protein n=1 Tax=Paenibacillus sp. FSL H7-0331 TaxID=1920421 RepID=UPI00096FF93F|nr:helix-turn-helix domain-containing protein [Paenibacillus sp. FSL H7-0331]OMF04987.1 AraC family transcriptional regulator [Paenibacillus sp. FSL H7-0331]